MLRPPGAGDVPDITAACQDPGIARWTRVPSPYGEAHARAWVEAQPEESAVGLLVVDAKTDRLLGAVGLMALDRDLGRAEVGFWTAAWARRRGVAVRAVRLLASWAFEALGLARIQAFAREDNRPSQRTLERAGFSREGMLRSNEEIKGERWDMVVFSLLPEDTVATTDHIAPEPRPSRSGR